MSFALNSRLQSQVKNRLIEVDIK